MERLCIICHQAVTMADRKINDITNTAPSGEGNQNGAVLMKEEWKELMQAYKSEFCVLLRFAQSGNVTAMLVKASILLGKGESKQAEKVLGSCTWMLLLLSLLLTAIMLVFGRPILLLFGASSDTISFAADYMNIYCLGTAFTQLTLGLNAFITAQGKTLVSMRNVAIGAVTNIVLDAVLINGFGMGVL